jgi:hypothetical protein
MVQGKGITAKWGAGYCFRTVRQRGMISDRTRHMVWIFCAKTILQDPFGQATIAAISGSVPTMFITRVRLQVGTRFCTIRRIAPLVRHRSENH